METGLARLAKGKGELEFEFDGTRNKWRLGVPLKFEIGREKEPEKALFSMLGHFGFSLDAHPINPESLIPLGPGSFEIDARIDLKFIKEQTLRTVEDMVSLTVPKETVFTFITDPASPTLYLNEKETLRHTQDKITLRIPGEKEGMGDEKVKQNRFTFELRRFCIGSSGVSLLGAARVDQVKFTPLGSSGDDQVGFDEALQIHPPKRTGIEDDEQRVEGEIEFIDSRFIYGALQASTELCFFDNAVVTVGFTFSQGEPTSPDGKSPLKVIGALKINHPVKFSISDYWTAFIFNSLELKVEYERNGNDDGWNTDGNASGAIEFKVPPDQSAASIGPAADLFRGITVSFEEIDPIRLGIEKFDIDLVNSVEFGFGDIFRVQLQKNSNRRQR